jgi:hypothetical protein
MALCIVLGQTGTSEVVWWKFVDVCFSNKERTLHRSGRLQHANRM